MEPIASESFRILRFSLAAIISTRGFEAYQSQEAPKRMLTILQNIFESSPGADLAPLTRLVCGGIAGITSVFCTYPLDIVRTRLSIQSASFAELGNKPQELPGMWATLVRMYKTEGGIGALYRGIIPTVAGVAPYVRPHAISWLKSQI